MTYNDLAERLNEFALSSLYRMMDMVEEESGKFPDWDDEVPDWICENFGYYRIEVKK